jgi:hypothetical protein
MEKNGRGDRRDFRENAAFVIDPLRGGIAQSEQRQ